MPIFIMVGLRLFWPSAFSVLGVLFIVYLIVSSIFEICNKEYDWKKGLATAIYICLTLALMSA